MTVIPIVLQVWALPLWTTTSTWWEVTRGHPTWTLSSAMTLSQTAGWTRVAWCIAVVILVWLPFDLWPSQLGPNKKLRHKDFPFLLSAPPSPHSSSRCKGVLYTDVNTREIACWVDGCAGLAGWQRGATDMAAEMKKSCAFAQKREEDDWMAIVTSMRRWPLYCCWTTMRTLSHFPEDCGRHCHFFCFKNLCC